MLYNKKKYFLLLNIIFIIVSFLVFTKFTNIVRAQSLDPWGDGTQQALAATGLSQQNPSVTIVNIIRIFLGFLGIIAVVIIMYAGFLWMTAGGNADQIGKAKKWMINGVIGLAIILSSFAIASFILARLIAVTGAGVGGENPPIVPIPSGPSPFLNCIDPATKPEQVCGAGNTGCIAALSATPYVCEISPEKGPKGTYVTIKGYHFNTYDKDKSKVEFYDKINDIITLAEIVTCPGNSLANWTDNRIIIKVPDVEAGDYTIRVTDNKGIVNELDNRKAFKVIVGAVPPGIACILPGSGKENEAVVIYGDYFGDTKGDNSDVVFEQEVIANIADGADWSMKEIKTTVPSGAMRGDVFVKVGEVESNGYPFTVVCGNNNECASKCCYNSSYCANATYCQAAIGEPCSNSSGCSEGEACGSSLVCDSTSCTCRELQAGDACTVPKNATCAESGECGGSLVCNKTSCVCENLPSPGKPCSGGCGGSCALGSICNSSCVCEESPTIYWISPDNGAAGNLVTIGGKNFGVVNSLFENVLTNVDFSEGDIGKVPKNWSASSQKHTSVGISSDEYRTSSKSIKIHQDPNQEYPGVCSQAMCDIMGCEWLAETKQCKFAKIDDCHSIAPAIYNEGQNFCWGNSNNVTWARLAYDISNLDWQVGGKYIIKFYYKGHTESSISTRVSYSLGWGSQCASFTSAYGKQNCDEINGDAPGYQTCSEQAGYCCINAPYQKKCYTEKGLAIIPAGDYNEWTEYSAILAYNEEMASHFNNIGKLHNEIGLTIGYNKTGESGTNFYVDDFIVAKVPDKGRVTFLGATSAEDDKLAIFPSDINPLCVSSWKDDEIIVVVPNGAISGPIEVVAESGISDRTDDSNGPAVKEFTVNNIVRPGLCAAYKEEGQEKKNEGEFEDAITLAGVNLQDITNKTEVYFGEGRNDGTLAVSANETMISNVGVPSIKVSGDKLGVGIFVQDSVLNSPRSNPVNFSVLKYSSLPVIDGFSPFAGHAGDYVTIYGREFGEVAGDVKFGTTSGDFKFPDICLDFLWMNNQIIVKVPHATTALAGNYKINVITNSAYGGNEATSGDNEFYVGDYCSNNYKPCGDIGACATDSAECVKNVKPGLCKISPSNGHENTEVSFFGENFGTVKGKGEFNALNSSKIVEKVSVDTTEWTNGAAGTADSAKAKAPANVRNGLINIISASGLESNGINFEYMRCVDNNECASNICCPANSYFEGSCMADAAACGLGAKTPTDYKWSFTTETPAVKDCASITDLGKCESNGYCCFDGSKCTINCPESLVPKVEEHCDEGQSCNNNSVGPSPSPWKEWPNGESACVDSIIRADFSVGIDQTTLIPANIVIKECVSENSCDGAVVSGKVNPSVMGFSFTATNNLTKNTWYQVTLKGDGGIKAIDKDGKIGKFLDGDGNGTPGGDYTWKFQTRDSNNPCEAGCAFVNPAEYTAPNKDLIKYSGNIRAKDNVCELLRNKGETWSWASDTSAKAEISSDVTCCTDSSCANNNKCILPKAETLGTPVKIEGTALVAHGSLSDTGNLYIDFTNFKVEDSWPKCNDSCLNAEVGARFSGEIDTATVAGNTILLEGEEGVEGKEGAIREGSENKRIEFKNLSLKVGTIYRVIVWSGVNGIKNIDGGGLDGLNYDSDGDKVNDSFSWEFKTGKEQCVIHSVSVEPAYGVVAKIGDGLMYNAVPLSTPDKCGGQKLNAFSYDWNFSTPAGSFASISTYPICGNGIVEKGEDCDRGIDKNGKDGFCSSDCLNSGNSIKCGTSAVGCCGNGKIETGEDCDGDVWCNDECLKNGSNVSYNSFCGNGKIEAGEDCDGEAGCDLNICVWRGTVKCSADLTSGCCGDGKVDAGEECDGEVWCSSKCLREGTAKCSGNCCGNGKIDAGEDCDLGNKNGATSGLCDASCLNTGNSATCGNKIIEIGEDCDEAYGCTLACLHKGTEEGKTATSTPYQLVTASSGPTVSGQTSATTDIIATEIKSSINGNGKFTIKCGYTDESKCPSGMGIGTNSCCYARPVVVLPDANITNFCPNGALEVTFNQIMDKDGLEKAGILEKKNDGSGCGAVLGERVERVKKGGEGGAGEKLEIGELKNWKLVISNLANEINNFFFDLFLGNKFISALSGLKINFNNVKTYFAGLVNSAKADATWCKVNQKIIASNNDGKTTAIITPSELLDSNSEYRLNFDGLKNIYGVQIANTADEKKITVSARKEICLIDHIDVLIDNTSPIVATTDDIFICAGRDDCGSATTELSKDDDANNAIAGNQHLYRAFALDKDENFLSANYFFEKYDPSNALQIENPPSGQQRNITANPIERADATISVGGASGYGAATTTVNVLIFMCENPWPSIEDFPYTDMDYNFSSFYCKDKEPAPLPGLDNVLPICKEGTCNSGILKEYLWVEK